MASGGMDAPDNVVKRSRFDISASGIGDLT